MRINKYSEYLKEQNVSAGEIEDLCEEVTLLEANQHSDNVEPEPVATPQETHTANPFWS